MGNFNCIKHLSERVSLIASDHTWIEGSAIQQLHHTASLAGMERVAGMPDLHPGRGYPVGAAFFSSGRLYPALVGNDIGCGMALWRTELDATRIGADQLEKRLGNIDGPLDASWDEAVAQVMASQSLQGVGHEHALGTIGGGNHFAEVQQIDEILDHAAVAALGLERRRLVLLVHSGSRGLGQAILQDHIERFGHNGLIGASQDGADYLARHAQALRFAQGNRELVARRMLDRLHGGGERVLDVDHNFLAAATIDGIAGWLHRKGATPADAGPVVIPGSRGDYSYLVEPVADARSLLSLAHGAGRKWMRGECKSRLSGRFTVEQLSRTRFDSRVICRDRQLIYEEAPQAYKPIDSVVAALCDAGLARPLARLRPVLTYKTSGGCCR